MYLTKNLLQIYLMDLLAKILTSKIYLTRLSKSRKFFWAKLTILFTFLFVVKPHVYVDARCQRQPCNQGEVKKTGGLVDWIV